MSTGLDKYYYISNQSIILLNIKPVNLKGDQPWIFTGRTDAKAKAPIFWSSNANRRLIGKVPNAGKIEGRWRKGHQRMRWLDGNYWCIEHELGQTGNREAWHAAVREVTKSKTWLGNWTATTMSNDLDKYYYISPHAHQVVITTLIFKWENRGFSKTYAKANR